MSETPLVLALDQGTTSSRAIAFSAGGDVFGVGQQEFPQSYPQDGWVEQDPEDIWQTILSSSKKAIGEAQAKGGKIVSIGITNQRETTIVWDRKSGKPIYPAIVWQDRRTADRCAALKSEGAEPLVKERSGLLLDPYFSATKISWILDHVSGARQKAADGELAFGTVDCWLLWKLTGGAVHATDATNASRTNLLNISTGEWDDELLRLFDVPRSILPEVRDCISDFGQSDADLFGHAISIGGMAGDQQSAAIGQCCFEIGRAKSTYGTGCFVLVQSGDKPVASKSGLLSTIAYQVDGKRSYALEGSIFSTGSGVKWLRDGLGLIDQASETEALAKSVSDTGGVYLVPAFSGLGAPHWSPQARGLICGLTQGTERAHIARAMLESVAYQTHDLLTAIGDDGVDVTEMAIDGGMVANNWSCQFMANICSTPLHRPQNLETTALGAAGLAAIKAGLIDGLDGIQQMNQQDRSFLPDMSADVRVALIAGWKDAIHRTLLQT